MKSSNSSKTKAVVKALPYRRNGLVQPFLKWAGGKRQLLAQISKLYPKKFVTYYEPFIGAGAVFLDLQWKKAVINDANSELINCYKVIRDSPEALIKEVEKHPHSKQYFYELRSQDRVEGFQSRCPIYRAARIIYLNKTCFNGLFRVNSSGQFNVPFGDYTNPRIIERSSIKALSTYLNSHAVTILEGDFELAVAKAKKNDFIYFDPPYDPLSDTSSFTGYSLNAFGKDQQVRLKDLAVRLCSQGSKVLLSNSATPFIYDLYSDSNLFRIIEVEANRNINSVGSGRRKINELLIVGNYDVNSD